MKRKVVGALLLLVIGIVAVVGGRLLLPLFRDTFQKKTSDAARTQGKIVIAMDNWIGYFPLRSPEMKAVMRQSGWTLILEDDNADYDTRMRRLRDGDIDFAVATVDSYLLNGHSYDFPGVIVSVIDESKGGDAILGVKSVVASLDDLKNRTGVRVAFTPDSPSHHLARAAADHFNVPELLPSGSLRIETEGSEKAREKLVTGKADLAILWEPDVSIAMSGDTIVKLIGTEDTERLIVDILVAGRTITRKRPDVVNLLLDAYFRVLKKYHDDRDLLIRDIQKETGLPEDTVKTMLKGVRWENFSDNCEKWYGIAAPGMVADEGLVSTIGSTLGILVHSGDLPAQALPDDDPYRLTNSQFLEALFKKGFSGFTTPAARAGGSGMVDSLETRFSALKDDQWDRLRPVGTLKVEPIVFQQGSSVLGLFAKQVVDQAVDRLRHYPNFRLVIRGHTGVRGDENENRRLSQDRADAVMRYLTIVYNIDPNRLRALGMGGGQPLPREPGQSQRSWEYRLPRVELVLVRDDY